jgi:hypothetical protein
MLLSQAELDLSSRIVVAELLLIQVELDLSQSGMVAE